MMSLDTSFIDTHIAPTASALESLTVERMGSMHNNTHYTFDGPADGPLICCVHGLGSDLHSWDTLVPCLVGAGYRVLRYDLIGRGFSDFAANGKFGQDEHIHQLHEILKHAGVSASAPVPIIAHSMGGALVTLYASLYPAWVKALVLLAPAGLMGPALFRVLRHCCCCLKPKLRDGQSQADKEKIWRNDFLHREGAMQDAWVAYLSELNTQRPQIQTAIWESIFSFPLYGIHQAATIVANNENIHLFILWGDGDKAVPVNNLPKWSAIMDKGKLKQYQTKRFPDVGHAFFLEFPEQTNPVILEYLKSVD